MDHFVAEVVRPQRVHRAQHTSPDDDHPHNPALQGLEPAMVRYLNGELVTNA
jgi:hypothetical protein